MGHGLDMAFSMVSPMLFGLFFGLYLDRLFHTKPWFMLGLTLLGVATGFWSLIKQAYGFHSTVQTPRSQVGEAPQKPEPSTPPPDHSQQPR
jgi:F0F1-type ATP synthase assembly protein I